MHDHVPPPAEPGSVPFVAEHVRHPESGTSRFTPQARLVVEVAALRRSGLLAALPDDCVRTLLAVLCFLTPNGRTEPTAHQVADVMGISLGRARERLLRLASVRFPDEPVLRVRQTDSGLEMFGVSPRILASRDEQSQEKQGEAPAAAVIASHREAIVGYSRGAHARPRAEVERMVLRQLGLPEPEAFDDSPEGTLRQRLSRIGMARDTATGLLSEFGLDAVTRQLEWLPYRHAKDPARYLAAAVRGRYGEPIEHARGKGASGDGAVAADVPAAAAVPPEAADESVVLPVPDGGV